MTIADFQISGTVPSLIDALNTAVSGSVMSVAMSRSISNQTITTDHCGRCDSKFAIWPPQSMSLWPIYW